MISAGSTEVKLYTPADLAELFGVTERWIHEWRRTNGWPSVRVGRTIRFTQAQVDEILERHSQAPETPESDPVTLIPGQSKASAARQQRAAS